MRNVRIVNVGVVGTKLSIINQDEVGQNTILTFYVY